VSGLPDFADLVQRALAEDIGDNGDVTSLATVEPGSFGVAELVSRAAGVVAGLPVAGAVFEAVGDWRIQLNYRVEDGARVEPG
jgi:nicotinate-nucleotide pyrophosphorylase (carboxylating)